MFERFGLLILLALIILVFALTPIGSVFLSLPNLIALIGNQTVVLVVAIAALVPLMAGYFDLSSGATTGVASITTAAAMVHYNLPLPVAITLALLVGALIGLINGILVTRYHLSAIIATLGMSLVLTGIMVFYTNGATISGGISRDLIDFGSLLFLGLPRLTFVLVPIIVIMWFLLENSPFGRHLLAIGSSRNAANLVGINVSRTAVTSFVLSGLICGVAGVLLTARSGSADPVTGPTFLFPAIAAVFLGTTVIKPGRPNILGAVIGVFFVAVLVSGLTLMGAAAWAPAVFNGVALITAAAVATVFARRRGGGGPSLH